MHLVRRLEKRWLQDPALQSLDTEAMKAIIDALTLAMYSDFESDADEENAIVSVMLTLSHPGVSTAELIDYAEEARANAAGLRDPGALTALAQEIASRVPAHLRVQLLQMATAIVVADREVRLEEASVLSTFAEALGFSEAEAAAHYEGVLDALGLEPADEGGAPS